MSIDGLGGGAPPGAPGGAGPKGPSGAGPTGGEFTLDGAGSVEGASPSESLTKLRSGEITVEEYLDGRVNDAVRHLDGNLPAQQLEFVKAELRQQLSEDPVLVELVRRATGAVGADNDGRS